MPYTNMVVEGLIDEGIASRLLEDAGVELLNVYGRQGKARVLGQLDGYNQAARHGNWFVLLDLDHDAECAPAYLPQIQPNPPEPNLLLRLAVREVESWILADTERIAHFLHVSNALVPRDPETLADPKRELLHLAARSRIRAIREGLVRADNPDKEGPLYTSELLRFVSDRATGWRPHVARGASASLSSCIDALHSVV